MSDEKLDYEELYADPTWPLNFRAENRNLKRWERCQCCMDDTLPKYRHMVPRAEFLAPQPLSPTDLHGFMHYVPVCAGHAEGWLDDCEGLELGPILPICTEEKLEQRRQEVAAGQAVINELTERLAESGENNDSE